MSRVVGLHPQLPDELGGVDWWPGGHLLPGPCEYTLLFIPGATVVQNSQAVLPVERDLQLQPDKLIPKFVGVL